MTDNNNKITINDVAKMCNVSKTTISRYLNGKYEYMSEESRKRIQKVIEELNYRPNNLARSLKSNKSNLIGVIVSDMTNPYYSVLIKGIGHSCKEYGYNFIMANTDNDSSKEKEYILSMLDQRVDGLIVHSTCENNEFLIEISKKSGTPIVLADRLIVPTLFDTVTTNDYETTYSTIQHLAESGFQKISFFTQEMNNISTRIVRCQAYIDACKKLLNENPIIYTINTEDENTVMKYIEEFIANNKDKAKAVFTANGVTMLSVLRAVSSLNLRIPEDIAVCGYEELSWTGLIGPGITAISQPSYEVGQECVKRLMMRVIKKKNIKPKIIKLPCKLIIRGSTILT